MTPHVCALFSRLAIGLSLVWACGCSATNKEYTTTFVADPSSSGAPAATTSSLATLITTPSITLRPVVSDGAGGPPESATWELITATGASVVLQTNTNLRTGETTVTFPQNGDYTLRLNVHHNGMSTTRMHSISVNVADHFSLIASAGTAPHATSLPVAGLATELEWMPLDGVSILEAATDGDGEANYDSLIGHPTDFRILIPHG